ncbi:MAG: phosphotransferase [Patescibacteria group bacterium]|jgi:thiamine kinase-like enzyme
MKERKYPVPASAQKLIDRIVARENLTIIQVFRTGPRFYVAEVLYNKKRALLKVCIHTKSDDYWTNLKFGKEVLFLQYLKKSKHPGSRSLAPHIYAGGTGSRSWYIREYITGTQYNIRQGNIRFRDTFFTTKNRKDIVASFQDLQSIRSSHLPQTFRKLLGRYDTIEQEEKLLAPYWARIAGFIHDPKAKRDLPRMLAEQSVVYDHTPSVLSHQEPYASHFIRTGNKLRLIDWENINWTNPVHDLSKLWMRAAKHPRWQEAIKKDAQRITKPLLGDHFDAVWETSLLIKSLFNVVSFPYYKDQADFRPLHAVSQRMIKERLHVWRHKRASS